MKKVLKETKALRLLLLSVFLVSFFAMPVFAVSQNQQGVVANLVTDKTSYEADETITTTVTVTNNGTNVLKMFIFNTIFRKNMNWQMVRKMKIHLNLLHAVIR